MERHCIDRRRFLIGAGAFTGSALAWPDGSAEAAPLPARPDCIADPLRDALVNDKRFAVLWSRYESYQPYGASALRGRAGFDPVLNRVTPSFYLTPYQLAQGGKPGSPFYNLDPKYDFAEDAKKVLDYLEPRFFRRVGNASMPKGTIIAFNVEGGNAEQGATYSWTAGSSVRRAAVSWNRRYAEALRAEALRRNLPSLGLSNYNLPRTVGITGLRGSAVSSVAAQIATEFDELGCSWSTFGPFAYCYPRTFGVNSKAKQREWTKIYVDFYGELATRLPGEAGWVPWFWPYLWQYGVSKWQAWPGNFYNHFLYPDVVYDFLNDLRKAGASGINIWAETADRTLPDRSSLDGNKAQGWHEIATAIAQFCRENNVMRIDTV